MRILFLCKRRYTRQDVIGDRYGRLWHLPFELFKLGHTLHCFCASYYSESAPHRFDINEDGAALRWRSTRLSPYSAFAWVRYTRYLKREAKQLRIDCVVASSDAFHIILGAHVARHLGVPFVADFYDNYESFAASRLPGAKWMLRRSARSAGLILCVSEPLKRKIAHDCRVRIDCLETIENGVELEFFSDKPQLNARKMLGLPVDVELIGTAGALAADRGIQNLFQAFLNLAVQRPRLHLALAGALSESLPDHPRIHFLGNLEHSAMPIFWRALDVAVVCVENNEFGRYCYPMKAVEISAAGTPMVFSDVGALSEDSSGNWGERILSRNSEHWVSAIEGQLSFRKKPRLIPATWSELGANLQRRLLSIT